MEKARKLLEQAVELDPNHTQTWFSLADAYIADAHFGKTSPLQQWPKARAAAARALEADSESAEAKAAVGFCQSGRRVPMERRPRRTKRSIEAESGLGAQLYSQLREDRLRDFVLNIEDVADFPIVALGPHL